MSREPIQDYSKNVLIIEDSLSHQQTLTDIVEGEGFSVVTCSTATAALNHVRQQRFGIVIMDLHLPDMEGIDLLNQLRTQDESQRVIIHTAFASFGSAKDAVNLGGFAYVEKAGDPQELVRHLHRAQTAHLRQYTEELETLVAERAAALLRRESDYRMLLEQAADTIFITDTLGNFLLANTQTSSLLGYTRDELQQMNVRALVAPTVLSKIDLWLAALTQGTPLQIECPIRCKDGTEKIVEVHACQLSDGRLQAILRDVTERKRIDAALRASELRFRSLCIASPVGIFLNDANGGCIYTNESWQMIYGRTEAQSLGDNWIHALYAEDQQAVAEAWRAYLQNPREYLQEYRVRTPQGILRWIHCRVRPQVAEDGTVTGHVGVSVDVTQRKMAEEQLQRSLDQLRALAARLQSIREEERTRIAREIHDELGQNLTALKLDLAWLEKRLSMKDRKNLRDSVSAKTQSMTTLIDIMISMVRRIATDLRPAVLDNLGLLSALEWQARDFQQRVAIPCFVQTDVEDPSLDPESATAIFRIFQEALTNVARHAQATKVNITLSENNNDFILTVQDNGKGITPSELHATKSLGLLGIHERTLLLGGKALITGVPGQGTTVTVQVPRKREAT